MAENKGVLPSSNVNTLGNANNKWENVYSNKFTGAVAGNAATATALQTARSINGTNFNGTGNITTANWGTARNISIADATATNTGTGVSVNGSGNVTLKLPATIKAALTGNVTGNVSGSSSSCTGNAATATKATQDSAGQQINTTYLKGLSISGQTITYTKGNGGTGSITIPTGAGAKGYITESVVNSDGSWYRKWSDGWLEQGGFCNATIIGGEITVNLLKPMKNTNYTVLKSFNTTLSSGHGSSFASVYLQAYAKTTTAFKTYDGNTTLNTAWYACGQSA